MSEPDEQPELPPASTRMGAGERIGIALGIITVTAVFLGIVGGIGFGIYRAVPHLIPDEADEIDAGSICHTFVKRALAFPDDADFTSTDATSWGGDKVYRVKGTVEVATSVVDSDIRMMYECVVEYQGDDKWELIGDLKLE